ncbi:MAG: glycosyltransferase family 4 protein, partial [Pseudomonadota bacterium]
PDFDQRKNFITIGNFLHAPNWDSVFWLKQSIWPLIRQKLSNAELFIYGAYTPQKAFNLNNPKQGFHMMGWAENALEVLQQARVCLAPLRFGAGIKGKLADAMLTGTPCVTTTIGAEAMQINDLWNGPIENSAEAFANTAVELYQNSEQWQQAQTTGFSIIEKRFNKTEIQNKLNKKIQVLRDNITQHRLNNFPGKMLYYHLHKSTEYMARWIEAKNANRH